MTALELISSAAVRPQLETGWSEELPAAFKSRTPRLWQLAYAAAARAISASPIQPRSIVSATALGALGETIAFLDAFFRTGFGSPRNFMASVHNSIAGRLAIEFSITGPNLTLCDGVNSLASALAAAGLLDARAFPCLVVLVDERIAFLEELAPYLPASCGFLAYGNWEEGAAAFVVCLGETVQRRSVMVRVVGPIASGAQSAREVCLRLVASLGGAVACDPKQMETASDSFVKPGFLMHEYAQRRIAAVIPTFDRRLRAAAVVEVSV